MLSGLLPRAGPAAGFQTREVQELELRGRRLELDFRLRPP